MKKRTGYFPGIILVAGVLVSVLFLMLTAGALPAHAARKVGLLIPLSSGVGGEFEDTFARHLQKFYKVPQQVEILTKITPDDQSSRMRGIRELLDMEVEVLLCFGSSATLEAAEEYDQVPILFVGSYDPIGLGLVGNLKKPGKNVTGVAGETSLAVLIESVLEVTSADDLGVLYNSDNKDSVAELDEIKKMSKKTSFIARPIDLQGMALGETPEIFGSTEFVLMTTGCCSDAELIPRLDDLFKPVACWTPTTLCEGAVFSYALDLEEVMSAAAAMTDRLLTGRSPGDLPVKFIKKRRFVIDMKKAKYFKLDIPFTVFKHATSISK